MFASSLTIVFITRKRDNGREKSAANLFWRVSWFLKKTRILNLIKCIFYVIPSDRVGRTKLILDVSHGVPLRSHYGHTYQDPEIQWIRVKTQKRATWYCHNHHLSARMDDNIPLSRSQHCMAHLLRMRLCIMAAVLIQMQSVHAQSELCSNITQCTTIMNGTRRELCDRRRSTCPVGATVTIKIECYMSLNACIFML